MYFHLTTVPTVFQMVSLEQSLDIYGPVLVSPLSIDSLEDQLRV